MVRVVMRDHDTAHGFAGQRACQQRLPYRAAPAAGESRIHHRPAIAIVQRVDIDMVQSHRQRQSHPEHACRHLDRLALGGRHLERMADHDTAPSG